MKFTLSWLKTYLNTDASLDMIVETLTAIGLEVEGVEDPSKALNGFKVGHVINTQQHPDADRLKVCTVDVGGDKPLQIVCGAPNARANIKVAFAPEGSYIPGLDVTLKKATIRGVESNGMMCSESELCLSEEHNGIIELDENAPVGADLAPILGLNDPIIDIGITPNRGDCAGVYGIARDLSVAGLGTLNSLDVPQIKTSFDTPHTIKINDKNQCPLFIGRMIKNVKNGPSPQWLQDRLRAIGLRPISALVDITNYFCIGLNRPLHVFDADKIGQNITIKPTLGGEDFNGLNDKNYTTKDGVIGIYDDENLLGLGGVVGGLESGCTETTTNVLLEVAYFTPIEIAKSGRAHFIDSDARYRFERGVDPAFCMDADKMATQMILDLCGGEAGAPVIAGDASADIQDVIYNTSLCKRLSGLDINVDIQIDILTRLGFQIEKQSDTSLTITVPSWRHDIEGQADFVEEILRIHGYDKLESVSMTNDDHSIEPAFDPRANYVSRAKRHLAGRGLFETVTWSFMDAPTAEKFGVNKDGKQAELTLTNPISNDLNTLRPSILANLINAASRNNARGFGNVALFEIGPIFTSNTLVSGQTTAVAGIRCDLHQAKHWKTQTRAVDIYDAKADMMALFGLSGGLSPQIDIAGAPDYYHPGRSAAYKLGKNTLGYFGEIHPAILADMGIKFPVVAFELFVEALPLKKAKKSAAKKLLKTSSFQPINRDFAFVVKDAITGDACLRAITSADKKLITDANIFDVYVGQGVDDGCKSLAINVTLSPFDKTLTDEEIETVSQKIITAVETKVGGRLR